MPGRAVALLAAAVVAVVSGCSGEASQRSGEGSTQAPRERRTTSVPTQTPAESTSTPSPASPTASASATEEPTEEPTEQPEAVPEPRRSFVTIPAIGLRDFPVVRYRGTPDDAPGTALQNAGEMASPRGPRGGTRPGEVGNYIVTGHRLTGTAPLRYSPSLSNGDRIQVRTGDTVFVYEVRRTRWTSFRQPASLRAQRAEVPGRPDETATQPMITLSTCATLEDHANGNYWSDEFDNPEHRIDKIGVLVATRPA
ncbi:class E sortase [Nocardioides cavernae]|uniref:Class E sortase n=1 Tax=Nocardioides cavernae TaxID=1921566 RepID=A0ABR8NCI6_9ACTN|nr:class E sortase [Nocardioides cavernae]MBD3924951.1 class E sortase [Nocardioides cavernae]MBM7514675.1 sortase A [Nocardioides cavernae]